MSINEKVSHEMLPHLRDWLTRVGMEISQQFEISDWRNRGHFAFMGICFLSKQLSHCETLVRLVPHKDSILVARTMAEGLAQFLWASRDPESRAHDWRAYAVLEDYWTIPVRERKGRPPTPDMMDSINSAMAEIGPMFLTKKAQKAKQAGQPLPKQPYYTNWRRGTSIKKVFEEIEGSDIWSFFYGPYSAWAHWSSAAFADRFDEEVPRTTRWTPVANSMAAASIVIGITTVLQTAEILFEHIEHPSANLPATLRDEFEAWHKAEIARRRNET